MRKNLQPIVLICDQKFALTELSLNPPAISPVLRTDEIVMEATRASSTKTHIDLLAGFIVEISEIPGSLCIRSSLVARWSSIRSQ